MKSILDLTTSPRLKIKFIEESKAAKEIRHFDKKWSFSNIYYFTEFRDVYLALGKFSYEKFPKNFKKEFAEFCSAINLPFVKTPWEERRILEYLNAFKNFSLVEENYRIKKQIFTTSQIGKPLLQADINDLKEIYFDYFRFKEFFSWLIRPAVNSDINFITKITPEIIFQESKPIFFFSRKSGKKYRFTDTFIYKLEEGTNIYYLSEDEGQVSRFWDVFTTWGKNLNILEKFRLNYPSIKTSINPEKDVGCCYVINQEFPELNLPDYLAVNYKNRHIYLPYLVLDIALKYRVRVDDVKNTIIEQYKQNRELLSFERTSEIFIKKGKIYEDDKILFPKYNGTYVSHLIIRK